MKKLLSGNQAVARGFYEAGGHIASSYPGSPTVDILTTLQSEYEGIDAEFSVNEKVALEVGIGASFSGARTMVAMKHVGVNIAMDPLMTFTQTQTHGGFLLVTGDDPGMSSSQNEQDNRFLGRFAHMPVLDPGDAQEAKDYAALGLKLSEEYGAPVMLRITSRVCHSRSLVTLDERADIPIPGFDLTPEQAVMLPPNTFPRQYAMEKRIRRLEADAMDLGINRLEDAYHSQVLVITSGLMYRNLLETGAEVDVFKLGMVHPLPIEAIREAARRYETVLVIEEMMPFIERALQARGISCIGKEMFSHTGEIDPAAIRGVLEQLGILNGKPQESADDEEAVARLPMFCAGCPHRPVFDILKKAKAEVIGDIGCYSLAALPQVETTRTIISMGASLGIMKGMAKANRMAGIDKPLVAVIGDGTFFHSGMTGLLNLLHQKHPEDNLTLLILNNGVAAMTGGQFNAGSGHFTDRADMHLDIPQVVRAFGIEDVSTVDQFDVAAARKTITDAMGRTGLSVIVTMRPCALNFKIRSQPYAVDPNICIACRTCVKTNCPPIAMKAYEGIDKLKSSIDPQMCVGCSVCSQVCPVGAISLKEVQDE